MRNYVLKKYVASAKEIYESPSQLTVIITFAAAASGLRYLWKKWKYHRKAVKAYKKSGDVRR